MSNKKQKKTATKIKIKNTAKALIINDDRILMLKKQYADRCLYTLAGGSQEPGESLTEALQRECLEEIGTEVSVGPLRYVHEYEKRSAKKPQRIRHKIEFIFECQVPANYQPVLGHHPDSHQVETVWIEQERLAELRFTPPRLGAILHDAIEHTGGVSLSYLGMAD